MCVICQDDFAELDVLKLLTCGHYYHSRCVDKWLKDKQKCPLCKSRALA